MRLLFAALVVLLACGAERPSVEDATSGEPLDFEFRGATGARDGDRTAATFVFDGPQGTLELDVTLAYDPQPVMAEGAWTLDGEGGTVRAESVRFVGGQGEGPSMGGVYVLESNGRSRFRVHLPLVAVETTWGVRD